MFDKDKMFELSWICHQGDGMPSKRLPCLQVNVTLLQASVVEEVISFSALDNIRDLTCVSLFSVCLDSVSLQFYSGHQSKKSVQMYMRNPHDPVMQKKVTLRLHNTANF